jgi:hypothetical protein
MLTGKGAASKKFRGSKAKTNSSLLLLLAPNLAPFALLLLKTAGPS